MLLEKCENLLELSVKQLVIQLNLATSIPLGQTTLREEILAGRKFGGFGGCRKIIHLAGI